jgi:hypothetical protein
LFRPWHCIQSSVYIRKHAFYEFCRVFVAGMFFVIRYASPIRVPNWGISGPFAAMEYLPSCKSFPVPEMGAYFFAYIN